MTERHHILAVDDEPQITRVLRTALTAHGYDVRVAHDGESALEMMKDWRADLVVTDLAMPNVDGAELCRRIRQKSEIPIIVLSVRDQEKTKIAALDAGADDYVTKPFSVDELMARIRANLRRLKDVSVAQSLIKDGDFLVDLDAHRVGLRPRGSTYAEGVRSPRISRATSAKAHHHAQITRSGVGRRQHRATRIRSGICEPSAEETRTRSRNAPLHSQ